MAKFATSGSYRKLPILLITLQLIFIVLFGIFGGYGPQADARYTAEAPNNLHPSYPMFQDIHIMIFIGFGFLMTFLKRYGYSALGYNFLLSALAIQWSIIVYGLISHKGGGFPIDIVTLIDADVAAAAVLITFGAVLGKTSPLQMTVLALLEVVFYCVNFFIGTHLFGAVDAGGSMFVHAFGAYFGLACAFVLNRGWHKRHALAQSQYHSDLFATIGTLFLWICWPSFNGALVSGL